MSLLYIVIILALVGLAVYLIETYVPMSPPFKIVIRVVIIIVVAIWLLQTFGIVGPSIHPIGK